MVAAAALVLAGAFFVGYVSELQRDLNDPGAPRAQAAAQLAALEAALGYNGFLKAYRIYRLTGDATSRLEMTKRMTEAKRSLEAMGALYADNTAARPALREASAIADTFAHIANTAPATGPIALRGSPTMESLSNLPQSHQLEAAYLSLSNTLDRVREAARDQRRGTVAAALNWTQMLFIAALGCLVLGLVVIAGVLHFGSITRTKSTDDTPHLSPFSNEIHAAEQGRLRTAVSDLRDIAARLTQAAPAPSCAVADLTRQLQIEIKGLRGDIGDMTIRMAEERILANGGTPVFEATAPAKEKAPTRPTRTLADVPGAEILARLKDLAAEMTAAGDQDAKGALKAALEELAREIKTLSSDNAIARLNAILETFDDHADAIEAHAGAIEATADDVERELRAITTGLRALSREAQKGIRGGDDAISLRERAVALGARAQSLFTRLDGRRRERAAPMPASEVSIRTAAADITALAQSIVELEARAEQLSRAAVAERFSELADSLSPSEAVDDTHASEGTTDGAIRTLFESIDRLNNVAAALARAGDADRQRRVAH